MATHLHTARTVLTTAVAVAALTVLAAGCGSDSADTTGRSSSGSDTAGPAGGGSTTPAESVAPETPAVPTIERASFCDELSPADISATAGQANPAELMTDRKPGDTYKLMDTKQVSDSWNCYWQNDEIGFSLAIVEKPSTADEVETGATSYAEQYVKSGATCTSVDAAAFGDPATGQTCSREEKSSAKSYTSGFAETRYSGLFGDTRVMCGVFSRAASDAATVESAAATFCALGVAAMSA